MRDFCKCEVCRKFRRDYGDDSAWNLQQGLCDICRAPDGRIVRWLPELLREFLGLDQICWACRNSVDCYMAEWSLCWAGDSDDAIKWALCDWVLRHYFNGHFYPHAYRWIERKCCERGHGLIKQEAA